MRRWNSLDCTLDLACSRCLVSTLLRVVSRSDQIHVSSRDGADSAGEREPRILRFRTPPHLSSLTTLVRLSSLLFKYFELLRATRAAPVPFSPSSFPSHNLDLTPTPPLSSTMSCCTSPSRILPSSPLTLNP